MRKFIAFIFILLFYNCNGQNAIIIEFKRESLTNLYRPQYSRFIFNDSFSFYYFKSEFEDPLNKKKSIPEKLLNHSVFCNKMNKQMFSGVNSSKKRCYYIIDTLQNEEWEMTGETKQI